MEQGPKELSTIIVGVRLSGFLGMKIAHDVRDWALVVIDVGVAVPANSHGGCFVPVRTDGPESSGLTKERKMAGRGV